MELPSPLLYVSVGRDTNVCHAPGFFMAPHSSLSPGAGGVNYLAGKFGSRKWAYVSLPPHPLFPWDPVAPGSTHSALFPHTLHFFEGGGGGEALYRARPDLFHHCPGPGVKSVKGRVSAVKPKPDSPGPVLSFDLHPPDPSVISNGPELSGEKMRGVLGVI